MATAEEFTLSVIELNPNVAYKVNDKFSVGFGLRGLYSSGVIKSDATNGPFSLTREMEADSIDFGYNLAMSYKPLKNLTFSTTYRSKVDLTLEGNAKLHVDDLPGPSTPGDYDGDASLTVPVPASFTLAGAYTMNKTTVEFVFERTYWSAYKELDFKYPVTLQGNVLPAKFDDPKAKDWKDVNAYRIGITHQYSDKLKLMAAFAIDKNPAPDATLGFELPDSDAKLYSAGFEYKVNDKMKIGLAYLYDQKESRSVSNADIIGEFTDSSAHLVTVSMKYKF
jgi:long-chain fatty acid transport protein